MIRVLGALMFVIGAAATVYYAKYFDVTVEVPATYVAGYPIGGGTVNNLGLMDERRISLMLSAGGAAIGLLLLLWTERGRRAGAG